MKYILFILILSISCNQKNNLSADKSNSLDSIKTTDTYKTDRIEIINETQRIYSEGSIQILWDTIPSSLKLLPHNTSVKVLILENCVLKSSETFFFNLLNAESLEELSLINCSISAYPNCLSKLSKLKTLTLINQKNKIPLPSFILNLTSLETLYLSNFSINQIQLKKFKRFNQLLTLSIQEANFIKLESTLFNLPKLRILDFSQNNIDSLSIIDASSSSLENLVLIGNPIADKVLINFHKFENSDVYINFQKKFPNCTIDFWTFSNSN